MSGGAPCKINLTLLERLYAAPMSTTQWAEMFDAPRDMAEAIALLRKQGFAIKAEYTPVSDGKGRPPATYSLRQSWEEVMKLAKVLREKSDPILRQDAAERLTMAKAAQKMSHAFNSGVGPKGFIWRRISEGGSTNPGAALRGIELVAVATAKKHKAHVESRRLKVMREPCGFCGVRSDHGCKHQIAA